MATSFTNTAIDHTSDAGFRAWGSELSGQLSSAGTTSGCLTQTADTGQVNWASVNRPGSLTAGGYEIWRLTDSLGVSAPVYIKVEYGTGSGLTTPMIWITLGGGTNGSGTLTGWTSTRMVCGTNVAPTSTAVTYPNYVCSEEGHLGAFIKGDSTTNANTAFFGVARPCDPDGTIRSDGIMLYAWNSGSLVTENINFATSLKYGGTTNKSFCMIVNSITATGVGTNINAFKHYSAYPAVHSTNGFCTVLCTELGYLSTDTATPNGATSHTYIQLGRDSSPFNVTNAAVGSETAPGRRGLCMLWE